jgi:hypothetical protein
VRGGFVHNRVLVDSIRKLAVAHGAAVSEEHRVSVGGKPGFVDLMIQIPSAVVVCEAELGPRRAVWDVAKASALDADLLLIVTPTRGVATRIQARLAESEIGNPELEIWVLPLGVARQRLHKLFSLISASIKSGKKKIQ